MPAGSAGRAGRQEHEPEVAERVQKQNRKKDCPWCQFMEPREHIDSRGYPEHQRAEQKIDGKDVHAVLACVREPHKSPAERDILSSPSGHAPVAISLRASLRSAAHAADASGIIVECP